MKAEESQLRPLIEPTTQLVIPLFQRFYVWDKKYWDTLWNDLRELTFDSDLKRTHFLGSLVFIPDDNFSPSLTKFIVIDGQQRITTLLIILAVIRDRARVNEEPKLAEEIEHKMLFNPYRDGDDYYKLLLSENDRSVFQDILDGKTGVLDHRLGECYLFFHEHIQQLEAKQIRKLFDAIADRLSLVTITLASHDNPYLVFESLNFKGHKLTEADLIRNYLFMRIPQKQQKVIYQKYWKPMEDALGAHLTEFVRHYLTRSGMVVKQSEVYATLKNRLGASDVLASIKELSVFADYYTKLIDPAKEPSKSIKSALERLNRLEITTIHPFLLNCYRDYRHEHLSEEQFATVIAQIENYLLRRFICGSPSSELNKIFAPLYNQAKQQNADDFVHACRIILQNKGYPNDAQLRKDLIEKKLYGRGDREKKTRFLLESLERQYKHKEPVNFDALTIEHIMPQTLTDWWKDHIGEDWKETYETSVHTLGNLTLTGYNGELSNGPFPAKRQEFLKSHIVLNSYFQTSESWRKEDILDRTEQLIEQVLSCWPYFGDVSSNQLEFDNVVGRKPECVTILDRTFAVKTWREVLQLTLQTLAEHAPNAFATLNNYYPHYIAKSPQGFRAPKELSDGYYIETNLGALNINRFCLRAVETLGFSPKVWKIKVTPTSH